MLCTAYDYRFPRHYPDRQTDTYSTPRGQANMLRRGLSCHSQPVRVYRFCNGLGQKAELLCTCTARQNRCTGRRSRLSSYKEELDMFDRKSTPTSCTFLPLTLPYFRHPGGQLPGIAWSRPRSAMQRFRSQPLSVAFSLETLLSALT